MAHSGIERRMAALPFQFRKTSEGSILDGYAAVFNQEAVIGSWFREVIRPGAFKWAITSDDVRALFNHDPNIVLARTKNNTLSLKEDDHGLYYRIVLNDQDPDATRVLAKVERGDVSQSSFAFGIESDEDVEWDSSEVKQGKLPLRVIKRVSPLYDVSAVTYPAYEATEVSARAREKAADLVCGERQPSAERLAQLRRRVEIAEAENGEWQ